MRKSTALAIATALTAAALLSACTNQPAPRAAPSSTASTPSTVSQPSSTTAPAPTTSAPPAAAASSAAPGPPGAPTTRPAPAPSRTFGPDGVGAVRLGMSERQALDTGEITRNPSGHRFTAYPAPDNRSPICVSPALGVAAIFAEPGMRTPEGIGLGSSVEQFQRAYPAAGEGGPNGYRVPVPGNPRAIYVAVPDAGGVVSSLALALNNHACFG